MTLTLAQKLAAHIYNAGTIEQIEALLNEFDKDEADILKSEFPNISHLSASEVAQITEELFEKDPELEQEVTQLAAQEPTPVVQKPKLGYSGEDPDRWSVSLNPVPPPEKEDPFRNSEFSVQQNGNGSWAPRKGGNAVHGPSPAAFKTSDFTRSKAGLGVRNDGEPVDPRDPHRS